MSVRPRIDLEALARRVEALEMAVRTDRDAAVSSMESRAVPEVVVHHTGIDPKDSGWRVRVGAERRCFSWTTDVEDPKGEQARNMADNIRSWLAAHWPAAPREEGEEDEEPYCDACGFAGKELRTPVEICRDCYDIAAQQLAIVYASELNELRSLCNAALAAGLAECEMLRTVVAGMMIEAYEADKRVAEAVAREREACAATALAGVVGVRDHHQLRVAISEAIRSRAHASPAGEAPRLATLAKEIGDVGSVLAAASPPPAAPDAWRVCEFCQCRTNAWSRRCCAKGARADGVIPWAEESGYEKPAAPDEVENWVRCEPGASDRLFYIMIGDLHLDTFEGKRKAAAEGFVEKIRNAIRPLLTAARAEARRAALEEAARVCTRYWVESQSRPASDFGRGVAIDCEHRIRALVTP